MNSIFHTARFTSLVSTIAFSSTRGSGLRPKTEISNAEFIRIGKIKIPETFDDIGSREKASGFG